MKINFTRQEYRQLLDLVFMGDWVASGMLEDEESPYAALREKIHAHAKDYGFDDLIEYDKSLGQHFETAAFEEQGVMDYIDRYNHHIKNELDEL